MCIDIDRLPCAVYRRDDIRPIGDGGTWLDISRNGLLVHAGVEINDPQIDRSVGIKIDGLQP
ncbi:hypothetical protein ASF70_09305 [Rhizobium sp. Leaf321]|nr:hypothetical protein ASF70_09305 [Rhizobium sp. Leaf321]